MSHLAAAAAYSWIIPMSVPKIIMLASITLGIEIAFTVSKEIALTMLEKYHKGSETILTVLEEYRKIGNDQLNSFLSDCRHGLFFIIG